MNWATAIRQNFSSRPLWMNGLFLFCLYMTFIYLPWDVFFKPLAADQEVWFGILFTGWAAKVGALLHWLVYGAGAYGFWKMRPWMHPWAAAYTAQIAFSMLVWSYLDERGGLLPGLLPALVFLGLASILWRSRGLFRVSESTVTSDNAEQSP
jgi:hypothetical protein